MFSVAFLDKYIYVVGEVCCVEKGEKKDIGMFMSFYQWRDFELLSFVDEKVLSNDLIKSTKKEKKVQTKLCKINSLFKICFKDSNQKLFRTQYNFTIVSSIFHLTLLQQRLGFLTSWENQFVTVLRLIVFREATYSFPCRQNSTQQHRKL